MNYTSPGLAGHVSPQRCQGQLPRGGGGSINQTSWDKDSAPSSITDILKYLIGMNHSNNNIYNITV